MFNNGLSLADIAAVTNRNDEGFGGNSGWWILIILFAIFGWGGRGTGFGGSNGGVTDGYILTSDFANIERKIDGVNNGLCDGFYTQAQLINGVQQNLATQGYETRNAITQHMITDMQNSNALQAQLSDCCCQNREAIAQVRYDMATQACAVNTNIATAARDINDVQNANTRAILDALAKQELAAKDAKIADQAAQIQALNLAASQAAQNSYIIGQLKMPNPIPAFTVPNPYTSYNYGCGCGC